MKNHKMSFTPAIHKKISSALLDVAYEQTRAGLISSLLCFSIVFVGLYAVQNKTLLWSWYSAILMITVFRFCIAMLYYKKNPETANLTQWRYLFILGTFLNGAAWGFVDAVLFPLNDTLTQMLIIFVLAGVAAGSVPLLSSVRAAAIAFLIPAMVPLMINLWLFDHHIDLLYNLALLVYFFYLIILVQKTHRIIKTSIELQFENTALLENLSSAKSQLETTNKKLERNATHDPLTDVANRHLFHSAFADAIQRAQKNRQLVALLYLDLDGFKMVNDLYGHQAGDLLLLAMVDRLNKILQTQHILSRLGGDEFTVILENIKEPQEIAAIADNICQDLGQPVYIENHELKITVSIGISIYPVDGQDVETLLHIADKTMYFAKEHGGNNYHFNVAVISE